VFRFQVGSYAILAKHLAGGRADRRDHHAIQGSAHFRGTAQFVRQPHQMDDLNGRCE